MVLSLALAPSPFAPHQRVPLDTVDLVAFSAPAARATTDLPLKAVHRGAVVGLRFVDLAAVPGAPTWKRMQVKFSAEGDAARFLRAVEPFCPAAPATNKPRADPTLAPTDSTFRESSVMPPSSPVHVHAHIEPTPPLQRTPAAFPPSFAELFPNLAALSRKTAVADPDKNECTASRSLASLHDDELERVVLDALAEEGFAELVDRVKAVVYRQESG